MHTAVRIAKKLAGSIGVVIATIAAFAIINDGTRTTTEAALIVFALGTTIIIVGLISRAVQTREHGAAPATTTISDELARLGQLHQEGVLTAAEFVDAKARVLQS